MVVGGTHSGVGKTTVTLGLLGALRRRGLTVQPFKVGPDFIDPLHHARASGRPSRNLDGWMLDADVNRQHFASATAGADAAIVEGVMGLYDGSEGKSDRGSTAEMAKLLDLPVVLVIDAGAMARSAAALIHGYLSFDPEVLVVGVVLNNVGGQAHADMIRDAVDDRIPIFGALPRVADLVVPERHLGLHLPHEARQDWIDQLASLVENHVDVDRLLIATKTRRRAVPVPSDPPIPRARIGIARDEVFCFYYADNLELLEQAGAELVAFSPLRDQLPPDLDGLFFGGGYPELDPGLLSENTDLKRGVREFADAGGPVYAECGGLMYLATQLRIGDSSYPLSGVFPFSTTMTSALILNYVEVETIGGLFGEGRRARGHVFHRSEISDEQTVPRCYRVRTSRGDQGSEGYQYRNVLASYVHLHFASDQGLAKAFVDRCEKFRDR